MVAVLTSSATERTRSSRGDLAALAGLTVALRLPAYLASAHLTFDDGVFGASAVAMRAGGQPYRDVFSSQGPLFLPLVWVADLLGLRTDERAPRAVARRGARCSCSPPTSPGGPSPIAAVRSSPAGW